MIEIEIKTYNFNKVLNNNKITYYEVELTIGDILSNSSDRYYVSVFEPKEFIEYINELSTIYKTFQIDKFLIMEKYNKVEMLNILNKIVKDCKSRNWNEINTNLLYSFDNEYQNRREFLELK